MARIDETAAPVAEKSVESSASAVEWASIFGGRWRTRGDRHSFDSRSGLRVDHGVSVVVQQSIANNFWHGRRNMVGRLSAATALGMGITFTPLDPINALYWSAVARGLLPIELRTSRRAD